MLSSSHLKGKHIYIDHNMIHMSYIIYKYEYKLSHIITLYIYILYI